MKTVIGEWTLDDYDDMFKPFADGPGLKSISLNTYGGTCDLDIEHEAMSDGLTSVFVPIEVMAEFLQMCGYDVKKRS